MKYYLIFMWDHEIYVHEFDNKKEAFRGKMSDDELRNYLRFCRKAFDEYFEEE